MINPGSPRDAASVRLWPGCRWEGAANHNRQGVARVGAPFSDPVDGHLLDQFAVFGLHRQFPVDPDASSLSVYA